MKILIVNTFYYPNLVGGTEQSVKLLAEGFVNRGHDVVVLTADRFDKENEIINDVKVIRLDLKKNYNSLLKKIKRKALEFNNFVIEEKILKIIDEEKPDIIHTNNLFYISPIIWQCAAKRNVKVIHTLRDYWGICPKTTLLTSKGEICKKEKVLCKLHNANYKSYTKDVNVVTAPSKFTLDIYCKKGLFKNSKKIMIPNAIDFEESRHFEIVKTRLLRNKKKVSFLFMGKLDTHKGIEFLIESFISVKNDNVRLVICGDGPREEYVKEATNKDKRIKYLGKVIKEKKEDILLQCDVMVVPSIWYEPFGRVIIEGYKYGLPVIGCNIGGISELINKNAAIGIEANSNEQLINAIEKLSDRNTLCNYIKHTHENFEQYNLYKQIEKFEEIYNNEYINDSFLV